jgi:hypothetical protein
MPTVTDAFRGARTIAEFANLKAPDADYFRHNYPDFAPEKWWDYKLTLQDLLLGGQTKHLQILLDDPFWKQEPFRPTNPSGGSTYAYRQQTTPRYLWQQNQFWLRKAWKAKFEIKLLEVLKLLTSVFDPKASSLPVTVFASPLDVAIESSYHKGITYLYEQKWRARFCQECQKRFVAAESKNICCSEACSHERLKRGKRRSWAKHSKEWRPAKKHR